MAETYDYLTDADKNSIIENHIRNLEYSMFNTEISIATAELVASPNAEVLANLNTELTEIKTKIAALKAMQSAK